MLYNQAVSDTVVFATSKAKGRVILMLVDNVEVKVEGLDDATPQEIEHYVRYVRQKTERPLKSLTIAAADNGNVELRYALSPENFERIRRITGYLVGTIDRWNDAKRHEEHERVKHAG